MLKIVTQNNRFSVGNSLFSLGHSTKNAYLSFRYDGKMRKTFEEVIGIYAIQNGWTWIPSTKGDGEPPIGFAPFMKRGDIEGFYLAPTGARGVIKIEDVENFLDVMRPFRVHVLTLLPAYDRDEAEDFYKDVIKPKYRDLILELLKKGKDLSPYKPPAESGSLEISYVDGKKNDMDMTQFSGQSFFKLHKEVIQELVSEKKISVYHIGMISGIRRIA